MPDSSAPVAKIQVGDYVAYRLSTGYIASANRGKVLAVFKTDDGRTMADVEWDKLGSPGRLDITNLTKV